MIQCNEQLANAFEREAAQAIDRLIQSERGRAALAALLKMLDDGAIGLDQPNQLSLISILMAAFARPSTTRDAIRAALPAGGGQ